MIFSVISGSKKHWKFQDPFQNFRIRFIFHRIHFISSGSISFSRGSASMDSGQILADLDPDPVTQELPVTAIPARVI
jgi:hypothetical protein